MSAFDCVVADEVDPPVNDEAVPIETSRALARSLLVSSLQRLRHAAAMGHFNLGYLAAALLVCASRHARFNYQHGLAFLPRSRLHS